MLAGIEDLPRQLKSKVNRDIISEEEHRGTVTKTLLAMLIESVKYPAKELPWI
jgi:hypothetical protein